MQSDTLQPPDSVDLLTILVAPHPSLKTKAREVGPDDADAVRALVPRMFETMYRAPGIGLAAPQVGSRLRLAVVDLVPSERREPLVLINPRLVLTSTELATREEGCLSLPNQYAEVTRPAEIRVQFHDQAGTRHELHADGLLAACLQHEIDHLDGVLFTDYLSTLKRNMILRRLAKEQKMKASS